MSELATLFPNLTLGFQTAVSPVNLMYCFIGVFVGTLVGVLPGIGPLAAIAMLPPTRKASPPARSQGSEPSERPAAPVMLRSASFTASRREASGIRFQSSCPKRFESQVRTCTSKSDPISPATCMMGSYQARLTV